MKLNIEPKLRLKQNQLLMMLPKMQQAIAFLQAPVQELSILIQQEMEHNPILDQEEEDQDNDEIKKLQEQEEEQKQESDALETQEVDFDDHDFEVMKQLNQEYQDHFAQNNVHTPRTKEDEEYQNFLENSICEEMTLTDFLMRQAKESFENEEDRFFAEMLINSLDDRGFLATPLEELAALSNKPLIRFQQVLTELQQFEPWGVAARNLQESFLIQLRHRKKENTLSYKIIADHYDDLLHNRLPQIQKALSCTMEEVQHAIADDIARLDLHPGALFVNPRTSYIVPDAVLYEEDGKITVELSRESIPNLRISSKYFRMMEDPETTEETKEYILHHLSSAKWLLRNIYQRNDTLTRVIESIARHQQAFLSTAEGQIKPLIMKEIAEEIKVHESTIARTVANKYVATAKGILPLRYFFSNSFTTEEGEELSSDSVRQAIKKIVDQEDKAHPLSDEKISSELNEQGIPCARRTVAKYRQLLHIGNTHQRKKF